MKKIWIALLLAVSLCLQLTAPGFAAQRGMSNFTTTDTYSTGLFRDVPSGVWYEESLRRCVSYGLMNGTGDWKFSPKGNLTVAQALTMAVRVHKIYETGDGTMEKGEPWYQKALEYALAANMVKGTDFTDYDAPVTRGQMAYLFARALPQEELQAVNEVSALPDVAGETAYADEILTLFRAGVVAGGDVCGSYYPNAVISRAEAAAIMARLVFPELRKTLELFSPAELTLAADGIAAGTDHAALGQLGDTMHSYFFDFAVTRAYTCDTLGGYTPPEGYRLLVTHVVVKNTSQTEIGMYDVDFQICWDAAAEDAYCFPVEKTGLVSSQLPMEYRLAPGAVRGGTLLYEIPRAAGEVTQVYEEYFADKSTGNSFFVTYTPA